MGARCGFIFFFFFFSPLAKEETGSIWLIQQHSRRMYDDILIADKQRLEVKQNRTWLKIKAPAKGEDEMSVGVCCRSQLKRLQKDPNGGLECWINIYFSWSLWGEQGSTNKQAGAQWHSFIHPTLLQSVTPILSSSPPCSTEKRKRKKGKFILVRLIQGSNLAVSFYKHCSCSFFFPWERTSKQH